MLWSLTGFSQSDTNLLKHHLQHIVAGETYRNYKNVEELNRVAIYIKQEFAKSSDSVWLQEYEVRGQQYCNVVCSFGLQHKKRMVIGAHYDVCDEQDGADDNASGVAGLLELSRLLKDSMPGYRVDLVAYTLEEPPFFRTDKMGSYVHAKWLKEKNAEVMGMISLEMIGYFSDEKKSQSYPIKPLRIFYGSRANYIAVVKKFGGGKFARKFKREMKRKKDIRTKSITAPKKMTGIDFSDHLNYWKFGFSAIMITDTSFYRNAHYHEKGDTIEILDVEKMGAVVNEVYKSVIGY